MSPWFADGPGQHEQALLSLWRFSGCRAAVGWPLVTVARLGRDRASDSAGLRLPGRSRLAVVAPTRTGPCQ